MTADDRAEAGDLGRSEPQGLVDISRAVQDHMGYVLYVAQRGGKHRDAKPLSGFGGSGAGVVDVIKDFRGDTFRAVYVARYADAIYVLHAFQKKSKTGPEAPRRDPRGDLPNLSRSFWRISRPRGGLGALS